MKGWSARGGLVFQSTLSSLVSELAACLFGLLSPPRTCFFHLSSVTRRTSLWFRLRVCKCKKHSEWAVHRKQDRGNEKQKWKILAFYFTLSPFWLNGFLTAWGHTALTHTHTHTHTHTTKLVLHHCLCIIPVKWYEWFDPQCFSLSLWSHLSAHTHTDKNTSTVCNVISAWHQTEINDTSLSHTHTHTYSHPVDQFNSSSGIHTAVVSISGESQWVQNNGPLPASPTASSLCSYSVTPKHSPSNSWK